MEQHRPASPPPARAAAPASPAIDAGRARWTPARQRVFLTALLETGSVSEAARAAGMNRRSAQRLRQRLAGTPFDRTWDRALAGYAAGLANPFAAADAPAPPPGRAEAASPARK